jgi:hypothetical protein
MFEFDRFYIILQGKMKSASFFLWDSYKREVSFIYQNVTKSTGFAVIYHNLCQFIRVVPNAIIQAF